MHLQQKLYKVPNLLSTTPIERNHSLQQFHFSKTTFRKPLIRTKILDPRRKHRNRALEIRVTVVLGPRSVQRERLRVLQKWRPLERRR